MQLKMLPEISLYFEILNFFNILHTLTQNLDQLGLFPNLMRVDKFLWDLDHKKTNIEVHKDTYFARNYLETSKVYSSFDSRVDLFCLHMT